MSELRRRVLLSTLGGGIPRDGLIAEYLFNNNLNDTSGNGYNLIETDATGSIQSCNINGTNKLTGNHLSGNLTTNESNPFNSGNVDFSLSAGIYMSSEYSYTSYASYDIFGIKNTEYSRPYNMISYTAGYNALKYAYGDSASVSQIGNIPISLGTGYHIIIVLSKPAGMSQYTNITIYVNGEQKFSQNQYYYYGEPLKPDHQQIVIGNIFYNSFVGNITNYRIYDKILSSDEILLLYQELS